MKKNLSLFLILTLSTIGHSFAQNTSSVNSMQNGKSVYETFCMSCHMEDGNGVEGAFPSLVKTGNLNDKNRMVKIILEGMRGPIVVKGVNYNLEMAAINLTDKETADVINYMRNSWGNKAPMIKASDIALAKKAVVKGYQPF